jgi:hypothetical protein
MEPKTKGTPCFPVFYALAPFPAVRPGFCNWCGKMKPVERGTGPQSGTNTCEECFF